MDNVVFVASTILLGIIASLPALFLGPRLAARGIVRESPKWEVVGLALALVLVGRLTAPAWPIYVQLVCAAVASVTICNPDLWTTFREGRWWWTRGGNECTPAERAAAEAAMKESRRKARADRWGRSGDEENG